MVIGLAQGASQEAVHVHGIGEVLAGGGLHAGGEEVAAAELLGRETDGLGDLVHVALKSEEGLRRAEAAEGAVRGALVAIALARTVRKGQ